ncbi:PP2C family serine/threonine-protein phosphatase [Salicibibacter kimchii]|uniref:Phosphoserine phosphatase n=1 Tax=Salicibibacter kimchii TaxID=2099786 RepID=A0A345C2B9_9BACI|nr:PP2C family serine/threonine-protein phosphatase [Salicibibacter kimchii]AXF57350.1 phosphoserine phosphatase [Salicibibacter kimchii]
MTNIIEEEHRKGETAIYQKEKHGHSICGDAYYMIENDGYFLVAIADGLGSGENANRSARIAVNIIEKQHAGTSLEGLFVACNEALSHERGVVMTILKIDYASKNIFYGNIGNVGCILSINDGKCYRPIPSSGFLAGRRMTPRTYTYPYDSEVSFVLYSDGAEVHNMRDRFVQYHAAPSEFVQNMVGSNDAICKDDITIISGHMK